MIVLEDLGSTNGTYLNGEPLRARSRCTSGDSIRIGDSSSPSSGLPCCASPNTSTRPTSAASARATRTTTSCARRCSSSPTAWAARRPARSRRRWPVESFDGGLPDGARPRALVTSSRTPTAASTTARAARPTAPGWARPSPPPTSASTRSRSPTSATRAPTCCATASSSGSPDDHSLVGELVARGKLTEEQAETHPQRSVITRALGPEPERPGRRRGLPGAGRRPVPGLLGRPDVDGPRGARQADPRAAATLEDAGRELIAPPTTPAGATTSP